MSSLKCFYFNAQSLGNKFSELHLVLSGGAFDIIVVTETWFSKLYTDAFILNNCNYSIYRCDRKERVGGGCCIIFKSQFKICPVKISDPSGINIQMICVDILDCIVKYRLIACYMPPHLPSEYLNMFLNTIEPIIDFDATTILLGDFNMNTCNCSCDFFNFMQQHGFNQLVRDPTRYDNILDFVFTNDPFAIFNLEVNQPFSTSDHNSITFCIVSFIKNETDAGESARYNFQKADWQKIAEMLKLINWTELFLNRDYQELWDIFHGVLLGILNACVPKLLCARRNTRNYKCYPKNIIKMQNKKRILGQAWQKTKSVLTKLRYRKVAADCRKAIFDYYTSLELKVINSNNLGQFYKYANRKLSSRSGIGVIRNENGEFISDPAGQADMFNEFFAASFVSDNNSNPPFSSRAPPGVGLANIAFTQRDVYLKLNKLKVNTAGGPDTLSPLFLKNISCFITAPLAFMFEEFFKNAFVPSIWSTAFVRPIFKTGDASSVNNYRPISLTCTCCKIMESIINDQMVEFLFENKLISKHQHGFIKKRSTCTQLLESFQDWTMTLNLKKVWMFCIWIFLELLTLWFILNYY